MRILTVLALFLLTGCGFKPLYASLDDGELGGALGQVALGDVRGPNDARILMRDALEEQLPPINGSERFTVSVDMREITRAVSVSVDSNARRFNYNLTAYVVYVDSETDETRRQVLQSVVSFAVVPSQYASLVGREDAVRRAVIDLARKIQVDAALYAQGRAPEVSDDDLFIATGQQDPLRRLELEAEEEARDAAEEPGETDAPAETPAP